MKKYLKKFTKILILTAMIISDLMTPTMVFASELSNNDVNNLVSNAPSKGDIGINNKVVNNGESATVSVGDFNAEGDIKVTKTVKKTNTEGRYEIEFEVKGKEKKNNMWVVVVFDKSGSMNCIKYDDRNRCLNNGTKWSDAVSGANTFASIVNNALNADKNNPKAQIALVQFSGSSGYGDVAWNDATVVRNFAASDFSSVDFGSASGGTNLGEGLNKALSLFSSKSSSIKSTDKKYVVVIGDGQPTLYSNGSGYTAGSGSSMDTDSKNYAVTKANALKANSVGAEIFTIGYEISNDTAAQAVLAEIASADVEGSNIKHNLSASTDNISTAFTNIANSISKSYAGTNASLTDNIGGSFTLTDNNTGTSYTKRIGNITEDGTKFSFFVDIDKDSPTGWYNTNNGFTLVYNDTNGVRKTIECNDNPQVYWVQNTYEYKVNYYKDTFDKGNLIKSESKMAPKDTVINESNVDRDKYLPTGYEFNTISPSSITITNDGSIKEINILYTKKKFNYIVNYYYDNSLESTIPKTNIPYGTNVKAEDYYLNDSEIREGYILDTTLTDNGTYVIDNNDVVINIYYKKNSYGYSVNYFFNNSTGFTTNDSAIYGDKITAESKWLSNKELADNKKSDFFLDPNKETENNSEITIGTDSDRNVLNIYYINTNFDDNNETITKKANVSKITSLNDKVTYTVNYSNSINNLRKGDVVEVTIVDELPQSIDLSNSNLNGGTYNSSDNTITWVKTYNINEFKNVYSIDTTITYTVKYTDYVSVNGDDVTNIVSGYTTVKHEGLDDKITDGSEDSSSVNVEVKGTVTVLFKDDDNNEIATKVELGEKLAGSAYTTSSKTILGYTLNEDRYPTNAGGEYTEGNITVTYYYTKNNGVIDDIKVGKTGPDTINSVNGVFDYTISGSASIKEYVGSATLTVKDTLPYTIDESNSTIPYSCNYDESTKTITCSIKFNNIKESDYVNGKFNIGANFNLKLVFNGIDTDKVINKAQTIVDLDGNKTYSNEVEKETEVLKGNLIVKYVSGDTVLDTEKYDNVLAGTKYTTSPKSFFGYTYDENTPSNANGEYIAESTITVIYNYTKNTGNVTENEVTKVQKNTITSIDSEYNYVLSYTGKIEDFYGNVTLELTDTLPYNATIKSMDSRCSISGKTITCTDTYSIDENNNTISDSFDIKLTYTGVLSEVTNKVSSKLIYDELDITDEDEVTDNIPYGKVTVKYLIDGTTTTLTDDISLTDLVGKDYSTEEKTFFGYTLNEDKYPTNASGEYTEGNITVTYYYTKNNGEIEEPNTEKVGQEVVESINGVFTYTINASAKIKEYVGNATLTVKDILPYEIDSNSISNLPKECTYDKDSLTITCVTKYNNISEDDYEDNEYIINESFEFELVFIGIDDEIVINKAESTIELDSNSKTTDDETITKVLKGTVIATYKDTEGNILTEDVITSDLVGKEYMTEEKDFFGYSLKEIEGNETGTYEEETIYVNYIYEYTLGTGDIEELPPQTGVEVNNLYNYLVLISMLLLSIRGYRKLKETL